MFSPRAPHALYFGNQRVYRTRDRGAHWETISAGAILVILPTLIVFLCLQRYIYNGFTRGATR